jgi:hypothetical protein
MRKQERLMPNGEIKVFRVKRLSDRHSEKVAERYRNRGRGYAKRGKRHVSDIVSPLGLRSNSRMLGDEREGM